ncbi:MAG: hypothetical protein GY768_15330 [Planctomycetaceae bacterium]|nr:hypothetical protein [Planctomycetaceae bacterium]
MIKRAGDRSWRELPLSLTLRLLDHLQAGVIYCPQHLPPAAARIAFTPRSCDDCLTGAVEGLDLAIMIADDLGLSYSIYSSHQATIRGICRATKRNISGKIE